MTEENPCGDREGIGEGNSPLPEYDYRESYKWNKKPGDLEKVLRRVDTFMASIAVFALPLIGDRLLLAGIIKDMRKHPSRALFYIPLCGALITLKNYVVYKSVFEGLLPR